MEQIENEDFFSKNKQFYKTLFHLLLIVSLQNLVAYSVNIADNIMLGNYNQNALSGAATVNQIYFIVQQITLGIGESLAVLASQYWGKKQIQPIRKLIGTSLRYGFAFGLLIFLICLLIPRQLLELFTKDPAIIKEGILYLSITKYSYILFVISAILISSLRSVQTVNISFYISCVSLIVNVGINYLLIFGKFGFSEMGIRGAAIGTLIARFIELGIVVCYVIFKDSKLHLFKTNFLKSDKDLSRDFKNMATTVILSQILWAVSVPFQTAILGHLSSDALAANSVATTFYSYLKVIVLSMASVSAVIIGQSIGAGKMEEIKQNTRTLQAIFIIIGFVLGISLFLLRNPILKLYTLSDSAMILTNQLWIVMSVVMVGMSYQMPTSFGIIRGGGDAKYVMYLSTISVWAIVMPLSFMSAFWWKWPIVAVVLMIQSDQIFKCIPVAMRIRQYDKWIKKLTREDKLI
jgi:putative MATE family efflux protein